MIFTKEQTKKFEEAARPLIKFLNDHCHPHVIVTVDFQQAELSEGICSFVTDDYLKD